MPENRKYFVNKTVLLVTSRTEEGLPIVPTHNLNLFIWGILGRAATLYNIKVCHFVFMANHFHMMIVVQNPEHVSAFVGYIKGEISHAINRLLGRKRKTVWAEGYDSPRILTLDDVIKYIKYIYMNPCRANLVNSIDEYPGVTSWQLFSGKESSITCHHVSRDEILPLSEPVLSITKQKHLAKYYESIATQVTFTLEPFAWMDCFSEAQDLGEERIMQQLLSEISEEEQTYLNNRKSLRKTVIGATALRLQSMLKEHTPEKFTKKMICISSCNELRQRFIQHYKAICDKAREVYEAWKLGDLSQRIPPGLFAPRVPPLVSVFVAVH